MRRLLDLHGIERLPTLDTRECLGRVHYAHAHLGWEAELLTQKFENARYGYIPVPPGDSENLLM